MEVSRDKFVLSQSCEERTKQPPKYIHETCVFLRQGHRPCRSLATDGRETLEVFTHACSRRNWCRGRAAWLQPRHTHPRTHRPPPPPLPNSLPLQVREDLLSIYVASRLLILTYFILYAAFSVARDDGWGYQLYLMAWVLSLFAQFKSFVSVFWLAVTTGVFLQGIGVSFSLSFQFYSGFGSFLWFVFSCRRRKSVGWRCGGRGVFLCRDGSRPPAPFESCGDRARGGRSESARG